MAKQSWWKRFWKNYQTYIIAIIVLLIIFIGVIFITMISSNLGNCPLSNGATHTECVTTVCNFWGCANVQVDCTSPTMERTITVCG